MKKSHRFELVVSLIGGLLSSLSTMTLWPYIKPIGFTGQLIAGNAAENHTLPSTLNMMHAAIDGSDSITVNITSYGWWIAVAIGTALCATVIFKMIRTVV